MSTTVGGPARRPSAFKRVTGNPIVETILIVIAAVVLAYAIQFLAVKPYQIPSPSMVPTLKVGDRILVNRLPHRLGQRPGRGAIVVFNPPECAGDGKDRPATRCAGPTLDQSDTTFVKRVVGLPGETVQVRGEIVYIDGKPLSEPYVRNRPGVESRGVGCPGVATEDWSRGFVLGKDHFFMMGDNRGESADSRCWGSLPGDYMIGEAFFRYFPLTRLKLL